MTTEHPRPDKVAVVEEVRQKISDTDALILTDYRGLDVPAMAELRRALRAAGGEYKVYKNTLVRLAMRDLDLDLEDLLLGPTALAFVGTKPDGSAGDAVLVAKALQDFAKAHASLVVKGGLLGDKLLDAEQAVALAKVPPRDEILARLAGGLAAPMQKLAGLLAALPRNFAYGLQALMDKGGAAGEVPVETTEPPEAGSEVESTETTVAEPEPKAGPDEGATPVAAQDAATEPEPKAGPDEGATPAAAAQDAATEPEPQAGPDEGATPAAAAQDAATEPEPQAGSEVESAETTVAEPEPKAGPEQEATPEEESES